MADVTNIRVKFRDSLQSRLLWIFLGVALIPFIIVAFITYQQSRTMLQDHIEQASISTIELQMTAIQQWLSERKDDVVSIAAMEDVQSMDAVRVGPVVQAFFNQWGIYQNIFVLTPDGERLFDTSGATSNLVDRAYFKAAMQGQVVASDILISRVSNKPIIVFAAPVVVDGQIIGVSGAVIQTTYIADLLEQARRGKTGDTYMVNQDGYFITSPRFTGELNAAGLIEDFAELEYQVDTYGVQKALNGDQGVATYRNYMGREVLGAYRYLEEEQWALLMEQETVEAFSAVRHVQWILLILVCVVLIIVVIIAVFFSRSIARPMIALASNAQRLAQGDAETVGGDWERRMRKINVRRDELGIMGRSFETLITYFQEMSAAAQSIAVGDVSVAIEPKGQTDLLGNSFAAMSAYLKSMADVANHLAQGDLTHVIIPQSSRDMLGNAFAQMLDSLRELVGQVQRGASEVAMASKEIQVASEQSAMATNQVAATMQMVAQSTTQQSESVTRTTTMVEQVSRAIEGVARGAQEQSIAVAQSTDVTAQISVSIEQVVANAQGGVSSSVEATRIAGEGADIIQATISGMESIKQVQDEALVRVREMGNRSEEIGKIVATIAEIASQTNLLALNANIEAARAGEHGKGFAVVADAVGGLATNAKSATKEIAELIAEIQKTVALAVDAMNAGAQEVEHGVVRAQQSGRALNDIVKAAQAGSLQTQKIAKAAEQMGELSQEMVGAMDAVSAVVEENTASTEEMASSAEEVLGSIEEIASVSEETSASAEEISASIEEVSAQAEEVTASAQALQGMAQELQALVTRFKLPVA